jgi:hypothetical protein
MDDEMTLIDIEYSPLSPPLIAEEKEKPKCLPPKSTRAPTYTIGLVDDPEPTEPDMRRLLFRIEQRGNAEVRLAFRNKANVGEARQRLARIVGVEPEAITLVFSGKGLHDRYVIGRLRTSNTEGITVYIKEPTEVLLLTAKALRRP